MLSYCVTRKSLFSFAKKKFHVKLTLDPGHGIGLYRFDDSTPIAQAYFVGSRCAEVVVLGSCLCGHLSCHSRDVEQQISKQLH